MKEFMLFIRKSGSSRSTLPPGKERQFLAACESYIGKLRRDGRLISAQPIERQGSIISRPGTAWKKVSFDEKKEVIGGYYHLLAKDLQEAIAIAKENPEFAYDPSTRIEVRPVKAREGKTGFVYPASQASISS